MMRTLLLGGAGMLGTDLQRTLSGKVDAPTSAELDIRDAAAVEAAASGVDVVINAAAYTRVDDAESHEDDAHAINAVGAENAARAAAAAGAKLVHVSTDYVFDGTADEPYREDAPLNPLGAYGRTKAEGERRVLAAHPDPHIIRTAWLYGAGGSSFPSTMLRLASERETVSVVTDQVGQPTWTMDLARLIRTLIDLGAPGGIYHGTNGDSATWFVFARELFIRAGLDPERVQQTTSDAFVRPAPRPAYSVLGHSAWTRAALDVPRPWRAALDDAFADGAFADLTQETAR
ncbi:MAG: dTDP-4-dehydrorhamnose reductase [Pseudolysinimonas sp.]